MPTATATFDTRGIKGNIDVERNGAVYSTTRHLFSQEMDSMSWCIDIKFNYCMSDLIKSGNAN